MLRRGYDKRMVTGTIQAGGDWPGYWAGRDAAFSPLATTSSLFNAVYYVNWIKGWGVIQN